MSKTTFRNFAKNECEGVSKIYYDLALRVAEDHQLLEIASKCRERQPIPNLFFGAVHFLLLSNQSAELAKFYPSINEGIQEPVSFELFKAFCIQNRTQIESLEQTKMVQTNALNRCTYLMPIISNIFNDQEINIIDIGASAGLNLNFDCYEYYYGSDKRIGSSKIKVKTDIRQGSLPGFQTLTKAHRKIGLDQNPLDLKDKTTALWLKALIWPDQIQRFSRMEEAIDLAVQSDIQLIKASTVDEFEKIINRQEVNIPLFIYHTHVLYQFTKSERIAFWDLLDTIGTKRDLFYLAVEGASVLSHDYGRSGVLIELKKYDKGKKITKLIAETNGHADWIKWID